jgi:hypothetical protein
MLFFKINDSDIGVLLKEINKGKTLGVRIYLEYNKLFIILRLSSIDKKKIVKLIN